MKPIRCVLIISLLATSCATIVNSPYTRIIVYTTEPSSIILQHDTIKTVGNKAHLIVQRKNEPLSIVATTNSLTKSLSVKPGNSFMYWSNVYFNYGIGMLVDRNDPKRYSYPKRIYINSTDTTAEYFRQLQAYNKGELYLHVSLPHINSFHLKPENEGTKINTGFWGLTLGLDYYHAKNQFVSFGLSAVSDFFVPVPAAVDISGEYEMMSSMYLSVSNNHRYKRFALGYGLSYGRNTWDFRYYDRFLPPPPTRDPVKKRHNAYGLVFSTYFQLGAHSNVGVVYRPTFYRPGTTDEFLYEHLVSVDFAWKIWLNR